MNRSHGRCTKGERFGALGLPHEVIKKLNAKKRRRWSRACVLTGHGRADGCSTGRSTGDWFEAYSHTKCWLPLNSSPETCVIMKNL